MHLSHTSKGSAHTTPAYSEVTATVIVDCDIDHVRDEPS